MDKGEGWGEGQGQGDGHGSANSRPQTYAEWATEDRRGKQT